MATVLNYGCHPSLGHRSSLLSPDYPGPARQAVEELCGGTCLFVLGACGETMPVQGHQGDPAVTDRDGRKLGLHAAAAITGMAPAGTQFGYSGPVVSGAVIGTWDPEPLPAPAVAATQTFRSCELNLRCLRDARPSDTVEDTTARFEAAKLADEKYREEHSLPAESERPTLGLVEQSRRSMQKAVDKEQAVDMHPWSEKHCNIMIWVWQLGDM